MKMQIKVTIENDDSVKTFIRRLKNTERRFMGALSVADNQARKAGVEAVKDSMKSGWPPNQENYLKWKQTMGFLEDPLFRTSLLYQSVSHERKTFSPELIRSEIGWHKGARYGGILKGIAKGRAPKNRKWLDTKRGKRLAMFDRGDDKDSNPQSEENAHILALVAWWNEHGSGGIRGARPFVKRAAEEFFFPKILPFFVAALVKALPTSGIEEAPF